MRERADACGIKDGVGSLGGSRYEKTEAVRVDL